MQEELLKEGSGQKTKENVRNKWKGSMTTSDKTRKNW